MSPECRRQYRWSFPTAAAPPTPRPPRPTCGPPPPLQSAKNARHRRHFDFAIHRCDIRSQPEPESGPADLNMNLKMKTKTFRLVALFAAMLMMSSFAAAQKKCTEDG